MNQAFSVCRRPKVVQDIINDAAKSRGLLPSMVVSDSHEYCIVAARRQAIAELRQLGYSLSMIGRFLGGLHHSTVIHHLRALQRPEPPEPWDRDVPDESGIWAI